MCRTDSTYKHSIFASNKTQLHTFYTKGLMNTPLNLFIDFDNKILSECLLMFLAYKMRRGILLQYNSKFIVMTSGLRFNTITFQLTSFPACAAISSHFSIPVACSILSGPAKM